MEKDTSKRYSGRLEVAIGDNPELSARLLEMKERLQGGRRRQPKAAKTGVRAQEQTAEGVVTEVVEG